MYPEFVERLEERGLMYATVLGEDDDLSSSIGCGWKSIFLTKDKSVAEQRFVIFFTTKLIVFSIINGIYSRLVSDYMWTYIRNNLWSNFLFNRAAKLGMKLEWLDDGMKIVMGPIPAIKYKRKIGFNSTVAAYTCWEAFANELHCFTTVSGLWYYTHKIMLPIKELANIVFTSIYQGMNHSQKPTCHGSRPSSSFLFIFPFLFLPP